MQTTLKRLNPEQRRAVETVDGRVLVLAGAGSGKTSVLTVRMAYLFKVLNCSPDSILGLTFTNKAAAEMRQRIATMVPPDIAKRMTLATFHSFCMKILRKEIHHLGYTSQFTLYDEKDIHRLVTQIIRDELKHDSTLPSIEPTLKAIAKMRSSGTSTDLTEESSASWHDTFSLKIYRRFQDALRAHNVVDFDHLLILAVELFEKFPEVLDRYQERFRYIMIDEYQDSSPIQYRLATLLSQKYGNLCVVGDDDQSIYGWRGAEIKNILEFDSSTTIKLEQNYRSSATILEAANALISHNAKRHDKVMWSEQGKGEPIAVFHCPTDVEEAKAVIHRMDNLRQEQNLAWHDFAILYRSNALSRLFEQALREHAWLNGDHWVQGIPHQVFGGTAFYERREVRDLMAYLRVIINPYDQEALLRIVNVPRRGIGEGSLGVLTELNRKEGIPLWDVMKNPPSKLPSKARVNFCDFISVIEDARDKFENHNISAVMQELIDRIDYKKAIHEDVKSEKMRAFKWENVIEFVETMKDFTQINDFLMSFTLDTPHKDLKEKRNGVSLMTFHSAKGLEFTACYLVGIEDHLIPHEKSLKETGIDEERRLMYVAMTRAKKYLTISMAQKRNRMGKITPSKPSRFLFEIPKELIS